MTASVGHAAQVGIRNRVNKFSDSVFDILSSGSQNDKLRNTAPRPATIALSRIVIVLFLLSFSFMLISIVLRFKPKSEPLSSKSQSKFVVNSKLVFASGSPPLAAKDYPAVLVTASNSFSSAQRIAVDAEREDGQSIIKSPHSEKEVFRAKDADSTEDTAARLIVITMDRAKSLTRLLKSLAAANYGEDIVDLDIWIDRPQDGSLVSSDIVAISRNLSWKQGTKTIHKRTVNAGLYQQWIYTWNITSETTEFAVILEDDLEVSPSFYQWLLVARAAYAQDPEVAAFTLQRSTLRPRQRRGIASGPLRIAKEHHVFKYRLLGTWGFAPQRDHWIEFRKWFEANRAQDVKPYVDGLITTEWYKKQEKNGFAPNMWSQWWIKFADEKNYFTLTGHLPDGTTLAANWRESGLHYSKNEPKADFPVFQGSDDQFVMPDNPILVDWDGLIIKTNTSESMETI